MWCNLRRDWNRLNRIWSRRRFRSSSLIMSLETVLRRCRTWRRKLLNSPLIWKNSQKKKWSSSKICKTSKRTSTYNSPASTRTLRVSVTFSSSKTMAKSSSLNKSSTKKNPYKKWQVCYADKNKRIETFKTKLSALIKLF